MALLDELPEVLKARTFYYAGVWAPQVWVFCAAHRSGIDDGSVAVTPVLYFAMSIALLVLVAFYGRRPQRDDAARASMPVAVLTVLGTVMLYQAPPAYGFAFVACGAVIGGFGMAWMYARWARFYSMLDIRSCVGLLIEALVVGSIVKIVIGFLPAPIDCAAVCFMAVISPIMLKASLAKPPAAHPVVHVYTASNVRQLGKVAMGVVLFGAVIGVINGMNPDIAAPLTVTTRALLHVCEIALGIGALWWVFSKRREIDFFKFWRVILVFLATGLVALPFLSGDARAYALAFLGVAQTVVVIFLWLAIVDVAHYSDIHPYAVFGAGWMLYALPFAAGICLAWFIPAGPMEKNIAIVLSYIIILLLVFVLDSEPKGVRRLFADLGPVIPQSREFANVERNCEQVGAEHGLTAREVEIMQMICEGRSKGYIAEALYLSENTVRSHSKHLYQKLDVHSKQELIDLVRPAERPGS